MLNYIKKLMSF